MITKSNLLTNFQVCGLEILKQPEGFALPREEGLTGQRYERFTLVGFGRRGGKLIANFRVSTQLKPQGILYSACCQYFNHPQLSKLL